MRITLETTAENRRDHHKSIIEYSYDNITLYDLMEDLIRPLVIGYGYQEQSFNDVITEMAEIINFENKEENED